MPNILFVCSANRFRSVLAAEYFKALLKKKPVAGEWVVGSAGIWAMEGIAPVKEAVHWAEDRHLSIDSVRSREISTVLVNEADLIIVMADGQREAITLEFPQAKDKIALFSEITVGESYDIPDPVTTSGEDPQQIAREIFSLVDSGFDRIVNRAGK
jgi:protein-tyrosine-phosphatase